MNRRPLTCEHLEARDLLTTFFVTSDADAGSGSFRAAIEAANADSAINRIAFTDAVTRVELESAVEYRGDQNLVIFGRGASVTTSAAAAGNIDLLISSGDANLRIRDLVLEGGSRGFYAPIDDSADGEINFVFVDVAIRDNARHGIYIDDQIEDSAASLRMVLRDSAVTGNGTVGPGYDGIHIEEGGAGDVRVLIMDTQVDGNGGDGLQIDEDGSGRVWMFTRGSSYDGNGFLNQGGPADGANIDESGGGNLTFRAAQTSFNGNYGQGLELEEEGSGTLRVHLFQVEANENIREGIEVEEESSGSGDEGNLFATLIDVTANQSRSAEGISLEEVGLGGIAANFVRVTANLNRDGGISVSEYGSGNLEIAMRQISVVNNDDDGLEITEAGVGSLDGLAVSVSARNNEGYGATLVQRSASGSDFGRWNAQQDDFSGNEDGRYATIGVQII